MIFVGSRKNFNKEHVSVQGKGIPVFSMRNREKKFTKHTRI